MTLTLEMLAEKTLSGELKTFKDLHRVIEKEFRYKNGRKNIKGLSSALKGDLKKAGADSSFEKKKETVANSFSMYLESLAPKDEKQETVKKPIASEQVVQGSFEIIDEVYAQPVEVKTEIDQETEKPHEETVPVSEKSLEQPIELVSEAKVEEKVEHAQEVEQREESVSSIWLLAKETLENGWFQEVSKKEEQTFTKAMKSKSIVLRKNKEMKDIYTVVNRARKKESENEVARLTLLTAYFDKAVRVSKK